VKRKGKKRRREVEEEVFVLLPAPPVRAVIHGLLRNRQVLAEREEELLLVCSLKQVPVSICSSSPAGRHCQCHSQKSTQQRGTVDWRLKPLEVEVFWQMNTEKGYFVSVHS
jgi:hypothetical protein